MKFFYCTYILLIICLTASTQFYITGQAPASVKWMQINTPNFQVIYPDDFYEEANRLVNLLQFMYAYIAADYTIKPEKISIILYNQSVLSNGYVTWAPRRVEWITTPPKTSYCQDWLEQLVLHEFRHVVQINNLEQGMIKILNIVFGEAATGAVAGYLPLWFLEGDAVWSETAYSSSGRGRLTDFDMELRAIELDREKRFSYDQSYLGSYKHFIPNHYSFGYQMVAFYKLKYGVNFWNTTLAHVARKPYLLAPFYFGLRKAGCKSKVDLYQNTFDSLNILWKSNLDTTIQSNNSYHYPLQKKFYTHYRFVQPAGEKLFAVRSGIDDISRFVLIDDYSETIIHTPGLYFNTHVSVSGKYIAWEEIIPDFRWAHRNYSVIKLLDRGNGKVRILKQHTRWSSPEFSPKGDSLVCVSVDRLNNFSLLIYDINAGKITDTILLQKFNNVFSPVWLSNQKIACIAMDQQGKHIIEIDLHNKNNSELFNAGYRNIENLSPGGKELFFSYDHEMARNIYRLDLRSKEIFRISNSRHGADFPYYDKSHHCLYYSDYTLEGFRPVKISRDSFHYTSIVEIPEYNHPWLNSSSDQPGINIQESEIPETVYPVQSYNRFLHAFTLHSWTPFYFNPDALISLDAEIYPGISLFSQNKLSTLTSQISYFYDNQTHYIEPRITLLGIYPVIEASALFTSKPSIYFWSENAEKPANMQPYYIVTLKASLPLQLTRNKYLRYLRPEINYRYINRYYYTRNTGIRRGYNCLEVNLYASNLLKKSYRDIHSKFGQTIFLAYNHPLIQPNLFTRTVIGQYNQYLPGLFKHHGVHLQFSYEGKEDKKIPILSNRVSLPRGYNPNMDLYRNVRGTFEYSFPVVYPDFSQGPLTYVKRIHSTLYYDVAKIRYPMQVDDSYTITNTIFTSFGIIIYAEMHFLRFFVPFQPGFRISYLPEKQSFDLGLSITLSPGNLLFKP